MSSIDENAAQQAVMARRRRVLASSTFERQLAICSFPISVIQVAMDMQKMMHIVQETGDSPESRDMLLYVENMIRDEFRRYFGKEMVDAAQNDIPPRSE